MADLIQRTDTLNEGREKLNAAIVYADEARTIAQEGKDNADAAAVEAREAAFRANTAASDLEGLKDDVDAAVENADSFTYVKEYDPVRTYYKNNMTTYDGSTYIAFTENLGVLPTDTTRWGIVARRGVDGLGAVASINDLGPDESGNISLTPAEIGAASEQELQTLNDEIMSTKQDLATFENTTKDKMTEIQIDKLSANALYKKEILKSLPLRFIDYEVIVTQEGVTYIYPQSFTIDWISKEILILYSPTGGISTKRWIVVYDLDTAVYKSCFHAGDAGGEGIVVKMEDGNRYLYVKHTGAQLGKYLLNTLPANLSSLSPEKTYDVGLFYNFSYKDGVWLIEQDGAPIGSSVRRTSFAIYDDSFSRTGTMSIGVGEGGVWTGDFVDYLPKRQGIALGSGYIVQSSGGFHGKGNTPLPYNSQGLKFLDTKGELITEGVLDPDRMIGLLEREGIICDRIENEGVHVASNGEIYTIYIHQGRGMVESLDTGIIIFKEMSNSATALDFSSAGKIYTGFNPTVYEAGIFPRSADGKMYNPLNGNLLDTLDKILRLMQGTDLRRLSFYSSAVTVSDISGAPISPGTLVEIQNANNNVFFMDYYNVSGCRKFQVYGSPGARNQVEIFNAVRP